MTGGVWSVRASLQGDFKQRLSELLREEPGGEIQEEGTASTEGRGSPERLEARGGQQSWGLGEWEWDLVRLGKFSRASSPEQEFRFYSKCSGKGVP